MSSKFRAYRLTRSSDDSSLQFVSVFEGQSQAIVPVLLESPPPSYFLQSISPLGIAINAPFSPPHVFQVLEISSNSPSLTNPCIFPVCAKLDCVVLPAHESPHTVASSPIYNQLFQLNFILSVSNPAFHAHACRYLPAFGSPPFALAMS